MLKLARPHVQLDDLARNMIRKSLYGAHDMDRSIRDFLKYANNGDWQSQAMISYHTELNTMKKGYSKIACDNLSDYIYERMQRVPELKSEGDIFISKLKDNYKDTLGERLFLAKNGYVVSNKVKPHSRFGKILTALNRFIRHH